MSTTTETGAPSSVAVGGKTEGTWAPSISPGWTHETGPIVDQVRLLTGDVDDLHADAKERDLAARTSDKARANVSALLAELGGERGMSWSDIAALTGVSVSAIRKWRKGGDATPENRFLLAQIAALLDWLTEYAIQDPAQWLEMAGPLPVGYHVRPLDLLLEGHTDGLLDFAAQRKDFDHVLTDVDPTWRETRRSDFEVFEASDEQRAIRQRRG